ncbi:MAG: HAMP domain-containing histidine kinase [Rhizobacter sp.]|nr:HAMP domain-containing histidine kinase [Bacteriovorax sp.]
MKTNKITLYFFLVTSIVSFILCSFFYFFTKEKDSALKATIQTYRENSTKLITDKVYEDLLIDNLLEAQRKLSLLKENKIIDDYQIIKKDQLIKSELKYCEAIFFDKTLKTTLWGKVCIDFPQSFKENSLVNLKGVSLIFLFLMAFIVFLIIFLFKKITKINSELYIGIQRVLNPNEPYHFEESFWAPVLKELDKLVVLNKDAEKKLFDQKIEIEKIEMANQVAHDIRSPLAALDNIDLNKLPDATDSRLAKNAIKRLKGIADTLLEKGRINNSDGLSEANLSTLINNVIDSKTVEFINRKIECKITAEQCFANIHEIKFESILSNLITNAFEASDKNSLVRIESEVSNQNYIISIKDQGKGMPPELLSKLGMEKVTFDKNDGNGLGVFYAVQTINSWGGNVDIKSRLKIGTTIKITLPIFTRVNHHSLNVLVDNDELVCITWETKAKKAGVNLKTFRTSSEVFSNISQLPVDSTFYIDSELDDEKGEDIAEKLYNMGFLNLIMCTGHSKEKFAHLTFVKKIINKAPPF